MICSILPTLLSCGDSFANRIPALLVSELVSNAVKHGHGDIGLTLSDKGDTAQLEVCDDGPGFPADFNWEVAANTGMSLIDITGRYELGGTISYENRDEGGARVVVRFPISALPDLAGVEQA